MNDYDYWDDGDEYNTTTDYKPQPLQEEFDISMFGLYNLTNSGSPNTPYSCDSTNNSTTYTPSSYIDWQIFEDNVDKCFIFSGPLEMVNLQQYENGLYLHTLRVSIWLLY